MSVVIDTNVLAVANSAAPQAGPHCVRACVGRLDEARSAVVWLDEGGHVLAEYFKQNQKAKPYGVGTLFLRHLLDNQANPQRCRRVPITPHPERKYEEFPDDQRLYPFDRADRKFVAVALASGEHPPIINASDSDWWPVRHVLEEHGVLVEFLCPELMHG